MMGYAYLTQSYKDGFIHTWVTSSGKDKSQAQIGQQLREFPTVTGCKRWITKVMRELAWLDDQKVQILIPSDFPVKPIPDEGAHNPDTATCGNCGLSWDDSISTEYTPVPGGRCPFEYFHTKDPD